MLQNWSHRYSSHYEIIKHTFIGNLLHPWVKEIIICIFKNQLNFLLKSKLVYLVHIPSTISVNILYIVIELENRRAGPLA